MIFHVQNSELIEDIATITEAERGYDIEDHAKRIGVQGLPIPLLIVIGIFAMIHLNAYAGIPMIFWVVAHAQILQYRYVSPIITRHKAQQRLAKRQDQQKAQAEPKWGNADSDDGFFSYDTGAASGGSAGGAMPYGVDKRHPDDAPLWAHVDDEHADPNVRMEAFKKVLKRQAMREGKMGRDVVISPT